MRCRLLLLVVAFSPFSIFLKSTSFLDIICVNTGNLSFTQAPPNCFICSQLIHVST
jgi:hypothetical protein